MTIRSTKTENRTPDQLENFMSSKLTSISKGIYLHKFFFDMTTGSTETGQKTGPQTDWKYSWINWYVTLQNLQNFKAIYEIFNNVKKVTTKQLLRPLQSE